MSEENNSNFSAEEFEKKIHQMREETVKTDKIIDENRKINAHIQNTRLKLQKIELEKIEKIQDQLQHVDITDDDWNSDRLEKDIKDRQNAITFFNKKLSKHFLPAPGSLILIPSMTNNGKSTFTAHLAEALVNENKKVLILSNEEKDSDIRARISCLRTGISFGRLKANKCNEEEQQKIINDTLILSSKKLLKVISPSDEVKGYMVTTVKGIMNTLEKAKGNFDAVLIDYYTNVNMSELGQIEPWHVNNRLASELNIFKDTCPYPIIMMAQCTGIKSDKKDQDKSNLDFDSNHPMYRWKGGQSIILYATDIIELTKDYNNNRSILFAHKVRFSHGDLERKHFLQFDKKMQRFVEMTPELDAQSISEKVTRLTKEKSKEMGLDKIFQDRKD
jgi:cytoplasmic iron level regulating protein YaaA (DUF328/UPF0246 family)